MATSCCAGGGCCCSLSFDCFSDAGKSLSGPVLMTECLERRGTFRPLVVVVLVVAFWPDAVAVAAVAPVVEASFEAAEAAAAAAAVCLF